MKKLIATLLLLALPLGAAAQSPAPAPAPSAGSTQGIVSAADPRAVAAGTEILRAGGSSVDAAIATMLVLNVVEPQSAGVGGGSFLVQHDAATGMVSTIDGREKAPGAADMKWFYGADGKPMSHADAVPGGRSVGVPGNLALMAAAHQKYGKLPWAALFEPAIRLARTGFIVTPRLHDALANYGAHITGWARDHFFDSKGNALPAGTWLQNRDQADLFQLIADKGPSAFYTGPIAQKLVDTVNGAQRNPSKMTLADLAEYQAKDRPPVCATYRSYKVCSMGPPSSGGITVLMILKQLERFDMAKLGKDDPVAWHLLGESERLAYADRDRYIGDPDFVQNPLKGLLDPKYLAKRSALISATGSIAHVEAGSPPGAPKRITAPPSDVPGTTDLVIADQWGNVTEVTTTIEGPFGSGLSMNGIMLNNQLTDFDIVPVKDGYLVANRVAGGKRPRSSMSPTIVYGPDGNVRLALGAAGGSTIIAQVAKAIVGVVDWKLSAQDAIGLGLVFAPGGDVVVLEKGTPVADMAPALKTLGQNVVVMPLGLKANAIEWKDGRWVGAADPRSEGIWMTQDGYAPLIQRIDLIANRPSE